MKINSLKSLIAIVCLLFSINASAYDFSFDGIYYNFVSLSDLTCEVTKGEKNYSGEVIIPSTLTYNGEKLIVKKIGNSAFLECSGLTSVTIGNSVTTIGELVFQNCNELKEINSLNSITPQ